MADPIQRDAVLDLADDLRRPWHSAEVNRAGRIIEVLVPALERCHARMPSGLHVNGNCEACNALTQARAIAEGKA